MADEEIVAGVIMRGIATKIEKVIDFIEAEPGVEIVYARRAPSSSYLLIVETRKAEVRKRNVHSK